LYRFLGIASTSFYIYVKTANYAFLPVRAKHKKAAVPYGTAAAKTEETETYS